MIKTAKRGYADGMADMQDGKPPRFVWGIAAMLSGLFLGYVLVTTYVVPVLNVVIVWSMS